MNENLIKFPNFNLTFEINEVAFKILGNEIYWYAILIISAFVIGLLLCKRDNGKYNIKFQTILEIFIIGAPIAIIGARIYYVLFNLNYYMKEPFSIFNIRDGGLAIYGGIIAMVITIYLYCKKKQISVLDVMDYIVPFLPLGQAIGRWGNFFNIEAYGTETDTMFRMGIYENGMYKEVHPTFLYESICTFVIFIILYTRRNKRKMPGEITYMYFFLYGIIRGVIEGFRADSLMFGNIRISQILSIILSIISAGLLIYNKVKRKKLNEK